MMSDVNILNAVQLKDIKIEPFDVNDVQPNSYDIHITEDVRKVHGEPYVYGLMIGPGDFVLGTSLEYIELPNNIAAMLHTRSSIGRLGISIHATAGLIDAGFKGHITYEITNFSDQVVQLDPNIPVGQLTFHRLDTPALNPYNGVYNGQVEPTRSKYYVSKDI